MQQNISPTQAAELINDLRELVETTTVESRAADETHATATAAGDSKRDGATEEVDGVHEGELAAETKLHTDTMTEIEQQATERLDHARSQYEGRLSEIEREAEKTRKAAHRNLKEQEWLAESVYEAAGQEPSKRLQLTREELDRNAQRLDALEDDIQLFRNRCRMHAAKAPDAPEHIEIDPDPETALEALREQIEECLDASHTLHRLFLPRIFIGPVAIIMLCLVAIIGWGACAGVLTLAQGGSFEQHLLPGLWGGLGLLVLSLVLVWPLRRMASRQFQKQDMVLVTKIAVARTMRDDIQHTGEEQCTMQEEQHRTQRDEDIKSAHENITPHLEQVEPRKERRHEKLEVNYADLKSTIEERRDEKTKEEQDRHARSMDDIAQRHAAARADIDRTWNEQVGGARTEHAATIERLTTAWVHGTTRFTDAFNSIREQAADCRPAWDDPSWANFEACHSFNGLIHCGHWSIDMAALAPSGLPDATRFAWTLGTEFTLPTMLHLPRAGSLYLEFAEQGRELAVQTLQSTMLRLLASLPPGKIRFTVIDPVGLGQSFAGFMHLADHEDARILEKVWTEPRHIEQQLTDLTEHMENVIQTYLRNEYDTIDEYNLAAGEIAEPYRYLVIADLPVNLSESAGKRLTSIMQAGARCGVYTLIACDTRQSMPRDVLRDDLIEHSTLLEMTDAGWRSTEPALAELPLHLESPPNEERLTHIVQGAGNAADQAQRVEVPFSTITPKPDQLWQDSTAKELRVSLGQTGATRHQQLALGRGTSQHALVAGKTGSGKSTLLHVLITNLALWYSPDEIEFYLVDFKKGVEFQTYAEHALPHARVIAIESDREFGLSVLQRIDQDLKERGERFRELGVQDLASYRDKTGEPLPRILLVVDEFQELFVDDDKLSQDASLLLDRLVRQGRAFGIHALLGSQTLDGSYSLARSTLGQMGVRIALQCTEADSYLILSEENAAARLLERPGEAIYNDAGGKVEGNSPFQICWLDDKVRDDALATVRALARERGARTTPPFIFEGNIPADLAECTQLSDAIDAPAATSDTLTGWLGDAIAIKDPTAFALQSHSGANLLVVGQREEAATAEFLAAMLALAAQRPAGPTDESGSVCFYILDGLPADSHHAGQLAALGDALPHAVTSGGHRDTEAIMNELGMLLARRRDDGDDAGARIVVMLHGLHRLRDLRRDEDDFSFSTADDDAPAKPDAILRELLKDGPTHGIHVLTWIDTLNNLNRTLDRSGQREFEMRVLFQMSANDSSHLIDSPAAANLGLQRALFSSEDTGIQEKYRPWAMPEPAWLQQMAERIRNHG